MIAIAFHGSSLVSIIFMIFVKFIHKPQKLFVMFSNGIRSLSSCSKPKEFPTVCDWKLFYFLVVFFVFFSNFHKICSSRSLYFANIRFKIFFFTFIHNNEPCNIFVWDLCWDCWRLLLKKTWFWQNNNLLFIKRTVFFIHNRRKSQECSKIVQKPLKTG